MGTFFGVYLPTVQNIIGVVVFLRIAPIIGEAGIGLTFVMMATCTLTTFLTILSTNAIVTNGKIRGAGVYYVVSRSLGPATGGCIGLLHYFSSVLNAALHILASVEAFGVTINL